MPQALGKYVILCISIITLISNSCNRENSDIESNDNNNLEDSIKALIENSEKYINIKKKL